MRKQRIIADRFKIGKRIGSGGMGEVFQGHDLQTNQLVAIKSLRDEVVAQAPSIVERFEREGEALRLLNHPNIVKVIAAVTVGPKHYIIMEYVGNGSLAQLLALQPQLPLERVREIALDLADALARAHRLRIIHRDIKPANVLLADDGTPRLSDFGIAHIGNLSSLTQTGATVGTYPYLSPEACDGKEPDERTDIWAFGILLFEMLAGRRPFEGRDLAVLRAIMHEPVPDLGQFRADIPPALQRLIYRMLEKDRTKRIASARQVGAELEQIGFDSTDADTADAEATPAAADPTVIDPLPPAASEPTQIATALEAQPANDEPVTIGNTRVAPAVGDRAFATERATIVRPLDFDVIVEGTADSFSVRVQAQDNQGEVDLVTQSFDLPFDLKELQHQRRNTADWVKLARIPRRRGNEELRNARLFGDQLFRQLFSGEILAAFRACQNDLKPEQFLRVRLRVPERLASLPWELLYDAKSDKFMVLANDLSLVRYPRALRMLKPVRVDGPLRVVAVLASPDDQNYQPIKLDRELRGIEAALRLSHGHEKMVLDVIRGPNTMLQLRERLRHPAHILHILSHGDIDEENGEGVLIFEDADGGADPVNANMLRPRLEKRQIGLVVLNACLGALSVSNDPFSSLGAALLQDDIRAVIAMQFELADDAAAELARIFYAELAAGMPVDLALREARLHLCERYRTRLDWTVPVLFLRTEGVLFESIKQANIPPAEDKPNDGWQATARAEIDAAEKRSDWERAIILLEQYCRQSPKDAAFKARLEQARAELELAQLASSALDLAQAKDWMNANRLLDQIAAQRTDYRNPTIDLEALRDQVREALAYQAAAALVPQGNWDAIISLLSPFEARRNADITALLTQARTEKQGQDERSQIEQLRATLLRSDGRNKNSALAQLEGVLSKPTPNSRAIDILAELIEQAHLTLDQRMRAATLAAQLGDRRPGVTTLPPAMVPLAGSEIEIARYPISTAQFQCFVEDNGYDPKQSWWQADGEKWILAVGVTEPEYWRDERFGFRRSNHPVVGVCWYEAEAFCRWLTQSQRYNPDRSLYRLLDKSEWQQAARGKSGHSYPWGNDEPSAERANFGKLFGSTTPVGCFGGGATSARPIFDLAGNVWEWTSSIYEQPDANAAMAEPCLVVQGGSWRTQASLLHIQHTHSYSPDYNSTSLGFRVVRQAHQTRRAS
jgi:hypothetical protein